MVSVTDARALENERRAQGAAANDDLPASLVDLWLLLLFGMQRLGRDSLNTNSLVAIENNLVDLGVHHEMQVLVN